MLNGVADSRESSSLSELSHPTYNIMCYKINVIHTTGLNSKAKSKKKRKIEDKYLISIVHDSVAIQQFIHSSMPYHNQQFSSECNGN